MHWNIEYLIASSSPGGQIYDMNATGLNESRCCNQSLNESVLRDILNDHFARTVDHYESVSLALVGLYVPVFFLGILGNGSLTVIILTRRQLRNATNLFLCNLAVADLAGEIVMYYKG